MKTRYQQKGFISITVILVVLFGLLAGGLAYWRVTGKGTSLQRTTPKEKSDGSSDGLISSREVTFKILGDSRDNPYKGCNYGQQECTRLIYTKNGRRIYILLGERGGGGYAVKVTEVEETSKALLVHVEEQDPGNCVTTSVMTYPSTAIELQQDVDKPVELVKSIAKVDCN